MARSYGIGGSAAVGSASYPQLMIYMATAAGIRPKIYEFLVSSSASPADNASRLLIAAHWLDAVLSHDAFDTVEAADFANFSQIAEDATRTVNPMTCAVGIADEIEQAGIFPGVIAHRLVQPGVKTGARHPQDAAHQRDGVVIAVLVHEAVLHSGSLAKYRAAFFNKSRSSSVRRNCERKRRTSLLASKSSCDCCSDRSGDTALTHLYRLWADTPKRAATSGT